MTTCTKCHRQLTREATWINGRAFGPVCAKNITERRDPLAFDLLTGIDLEGAGIQAMERINAGIEVLAARHLADMRASWRAA
jgi:hypothetical protein